jgi:hypothetical protein
LGVTKVKRELTLYRETLSFLNEIGVVGAVEVDADIVDADGVARRNCSADVVDVDEGAA